ncbi:MAG: hypothetical protein GKR95_19220 [Gammaproteobacteria bacterium]|nr:hypothetical protein [Gammaproteobacteria bacterium]
MDWCVWPDHVTTANSAYAGRIHKAVEKDNYSEVKRQIAKGKINAKDRYGSTPLHIASLNGKEEIARILIQKGAEVNNENSNRNTPLMLASYGGNNAIVRLLIDNGARVDARNQDGNSSLLFAAWQGHLDVVATLISNGTDVNAVDHAKQSALFLASRHNHPALIEKLLMAGASKTIITSGGESAMSVAKRKGYKQIIGALSKEYSSPASLSDKKSQSKNTHLANLDNWDYKSAKILGVSLGDRFSEINLPEGFVCTQESEQYIGSEYARTMSCESTKRLHNTNIPRENLVLDFDHNLQIYKISRSVYFLEEPNHDKLISDLVGYYGETTFVSRKYGGPNTNSKDELCWGSCKIKGKSGGLLQPTGPGIFNRIIPTKQGRMFLVRFERPQGYYVQVSNALRFFQTDYDRLEDNHAHLKTLQQNQKQQAIEKEEKVDF